MPMVHVASSRQASGGAVHCDDIRRLENELYIGLVLSSKASAKILKCICIEIFDNFFYWLI